MVAFPFYANAIEVGGNPASGARLQSYVKSTTTPLPLWLDSGLSIPATNPVIADSDGRFEIYADSTKDYTWQIRNSDQSVVLWEADVTGGVLAVTYVNGILIESSWANPLATPLGAGWPAAFALPVPDGLSGQFIKPVATYAALTALVAGTGLQDDGVYYTYARVLDDDGGAGFWRYDAASVAAVDGGTILAINGGGAGRFIRQFTSPASSAWFITPHASNVQTTALQAFLNCAPDLWLEEGTIVFAAVTVPADTRLRGTRAAILKQSTATGTAISLGGDNISLEGFTLNGTQTTDTFAGGYTANHIGISCVGTSGAPKTNISIEGMSIQNFGDSGIYTKFVTDKRIKRNDVTRCGYAGIQGLSSLDAWVEENDVSNIFPGDGAANCYGIVETRSGSDRVPTNVHLDYNRVDAVLPWEGVDIHDGKHSSISNNIISNCAQGIAYENHITGAPGDDIRIDNNIILGWTGATTTKDGQTYRKTAGIVAVGGDTNESGTTLSIHGNNITGMGDTRLVSSAASIFIRNWDGVDVSGNNLRDSYRCGIGTGNSGTAGVLNAVINDNNVVNVTAQGGVCRGFEIGTLTSGSGVGNRVTGLASGTEEYYQAPNATRAFKFVIPKEILLAARTLYVRSDGSNSNTGLANSAAGALLTIQAGIDAAAALDLNGYDVTIQVAGGTWTQGLTGRTLTGAGKVILLGDETTPANVIISATSDDCFEANDISGRYALRGFRLQTTTNGHAIVAQGIRSEIEFQNIDFGGVAAGNRHMSAVDGGFIEATGNYSISGSAANHYYALLGGYINTAGRTVTTTLTPAFSAAYAEARRLGRVNGPSMTFSGTGATGPRYTAQENSLIYIGTGSTTYFPGNAAHASPTATGGQYV